MGANWREVNYTDVTVAYTLPRAGKRGVIVVTVRPGLVQDEEIHIAMQNFLAAIQQLKKLAP
jgi:hypothetical protein